ncbi:MAG: glycine/sarcosine/betaine reductase selenoprotein B family protein [Proteobacteria bacterium]|nr:glycine/sarcosine/betaine reductase selenoprotein B family protein [Pseudomonadota bacterium]
MSDASIKAFGDNLPCPTFEEPAFVKPKPLNRSRVAIVTSAALHHEGDDQFAAKDTSYRILDANRRDVVLGHWSPNFDRSGFAEDINTVWPIDRLFELAQQGVIGSVAPRHLSFAGNQDETMTGLRLDSGPAAAALLKDDEVDLVILTPV